MATLTYSITNLRNANGSNAVGIWFGTVPIYGDYSGSTLSNVTISSVKLRIDKARSTGPGPMKLEINNQTLNTSEVPWTGGDTSTSFNLDVTGFNNNLCSAASGTIKITPRQSSAYSGVLMLETYTIYLDITYQPNTTACGAPTTVSISKDNAAPGGAATLSWSGATAGTGNAITGYHIYRSTSVSGTYSYLSAVSTSATSGSATVYAPQTKGDLYFYKVYTIGSVSGYNSGISSSYASLLCTYGTPSSPALYISSSHTSGARKIELLVGNAYDTTFSILLNWDASSDGINNPVSGYEVYRDDSLIATVSSSTVEYQITDMSMILANHTYSVLAKGTVSGDDSPKAATVQTTVISSPAAVAGLTSSYPGNKAFDATQISWTAVDGSYTYVLSSANGFSNSTMENSYTISLVNDLALNSEGSSASVGVVRRQYARDGGYVDSTKASITLTKAPALTIDDSTLWESYFDSQSTFCTNEYNTKGTYKNSTYYNGIKFYWNVDTTKNYNYILQISDSSTFSNVTNLVYSNPYTYSTTASSFYVRLIISDQYGSQAYSYPTISDGAGDTIVVKFGRITPIEPLSLSVNYITYNTYGVNYQVRTNPQIPTTDMQGSLSFYYGSALIYSTKQSGFTANGLPNNSLTGIYTNSNCNFLENTTLKNDVNTYYLRNPEGTLKFELWPKQFPNCVSTLQINMNYNFTRTIAQLTTNEIVFGNLVSDVPTGGTSAVKYANGSSDITYGFTTTGISKLNQYTDSLTSVLSNPPIVYTITYTQGSSSKSATKNSNNVNTFTIFKTTSDTTATFTLTAAIQYGKKDGTKDLQTQWSIKNTINVARWTEDNIQVSVNYSNNTIIGTIDLSSGNCGSSYYNNMLAVDVYIVVNDGDPHEVTNKTGTDKITASFPYSLSDGATKVYYIIDFVNSSADTITILTKNFSLRQGDVELTVRRGRVGINVPSDFAPGGVNSTDATFTIMPRSGGDSQSSLVELITSSTSTYGPSIRFMIDTREVGKIYTLSNDSYLTISGMRIANTTELNTLDWS